MSLPTFKDTHEQCKASGQPCDYWGEYESWLVVLGRSKNSDVLERSNFDAACTSLETISTDDYTIEKEKHWLVGWVETLLVNPNNQLMVAAAEQIIESIKEYPILDETLHSQYENDECSETWSDCLDWHDRLTWLKTHDFTGTFIQLLSAVRGSWNDASDILHDPSGILY